MTLNNIILMTSDIKVGTSKNLFCRDRCWQLINNHYGGNVFTSIPGSRLRKCSYGDTCRGAHTEEEINTLPHVHKFNCLDKKKLDLVPIYNNIRDVFETSKDKVKDKDLKLRLNDYQELNFIELMNLWFDLTCYHRKIKKEMLKDKSYKSEFPDIKSIPEFLLENEDIVWPLERITKLCPINQKLLTKINSKDEKPIIWDICLASINCKLGCHNISNMICNDNFLTGTCDCISKEEFDSQKEEIVLQIAQLKDQSNPIDGFQAVKPSKRKKHLNQLEIKKLTTKLNGMRRKLHFTELEMKPFNKQLSEYQESVIEKKKEVEKEITDREKKMKKVVKKKITKPRF